MVSRLITVLGMVGVEAFSTSVAASGDAPVPYGQGDDTPPTRVLVVYAADEHNQIKVLADAVAEGAGSIGADTKVMEVASANYKRHVFGWADAVVLGSGVFNGNAAPRLLEFINSFDFMDSLQTKVGGAFVTGGAAGGGVQMVLDSLNRGMKTFGMVTIGGRNWRNTDGTVGLTTGDESIDDANHTLALARDQGSRIAQLATTLRRSSSVSGELDAPVPGVTRVLDSVAWSLGQGKWSEETRLHVTCEAYCRGWSAAVGCGTCSPSAFSFDGAAQMCIHPGPLGTGLLCRMDQTTLEVTGESCCGVGGPCEIPQPDAPMDNTSMWPGGCCYGGNCGNCPGGSPLSDNFPLLTDSRTHSSNRRYFDHKTFTCMVGVDPATYNFV